MLIRHIGEIELGKQVICSDPCYLRREDWKKETILETKSGRWACSVVIWKRIAYIEAITESDVNEKPWIQADVLHVDSGQMGIFDRSIVEQITPANFEEFYEKCCTITCQNFPAGILSNKIAVTSSGYGDGIYDLLVKKNGNNRVIGIRIVFFYPEK